MEQTWYIYLDNQLSMFLVIQNGLLFVDIDNQFSTAFLGQKCFVCMLVIMLEKVKLTHRNSYCTVTI